MVLPSMIAVGPTLGRIVINIGRKTIFSKRVPKVLREYLDKHVLKIIPFIRQSLVKAGVPAKETAITYTATVDGVYAQVFTLTPTVKTIAATPAIIAAVGSSIATAVALAKEDAKKVIPKRKTKRNSKKYDLTPKQKAKLKKDGHIYITRNKKQIRIQR